MNRLRTSGSTKKPGRTLYESVIRATTAVPRDGNHRGRVQSGNNIEPRRLILQNDAGAKGRGFIWLCRESTVCVLKMILSIRHGQS